VIGRISPEKGQADFLRAARILHNVAPQCRFLICGAPLFSNPAAMRYCAELEALAEGLPVEFAGWTEDVEGVLATLDLLVVPSTAVDATPRVILEGFAAGVPVMAFASGGIPEIVEHGVTGFLVEERSPKALAFAMLDALEAPPACAKWPNEGARAKARGEFSLERYRAQMIEPESASGSEAEPPRLPRSPRTCSALWCCSDTPAPAFQSCGSSFWRYYSRISGEAGCRRVGRRARKPTALQSG
jgi:glycosyltransferase involved in cell wall biosynthesis